MIESEAFILFSSHLRTIQDSNPTLSAISFSNRLLGHL